MFGYPKHLNTKADFEYVKEHFPEENWKPDVQDLLDNRHGMYPVAVMTKGAPGVTDATHLVDTQDGKLIQYEQKINPAARYKQLGFTVVELDGWMKETITVVEKPVEEMPVDIKPVGETILTK